MKICATCGENKPLNEYYKHKRARDGHDGTCKACRLARKYELRRERDKNYGKCRMCGGEREYGKSYCDKCGGGIIRNTDWIMDGSFVEVSVRTLSALNSIVVKYHLHHHCYEELREWMKSGSVQVDPG